MVIIQTTKNHITTKRAKTSTSGPQYFINTINQAIIISTYWSCPGIHIQALKPAMKGCNSRNYEEERDGQEPAKAEVAGGATNQPAATIAVRTRLASEEHCH